jgi:hypothetical protein
MGRKGEANKVVCKELRDAKPVLARKEIGDTETGVTVGDDKPSLVRNLVSSNTTCLDTYTLREI